MEKATTGDAKEQTMELRRRRREGEDYAAIGSDWICILHAGLHNDNPKASMHPARCIGGPFRVKISLTGEHAKVGWPSCKVELDAVELDVPSKDDRSEVCPRYVKR